MTTALTELLALRAYLDAVAANGRTWATGSLLSAVSPDDRDRLSRFYANIDSAHRADDEASLRNAGLLANLVDAAYGKGAAERLGYPRGLLTRVRRVFVVARRVARNDYAWTRDADELRRHTRREK